MVTCGSRIFQRRALHDAAEAEQGDDEQDAVEAGVIMDPDQERGAPAEIEQARHDVIDGAEDDEAEEAVDPEEAGCTRGTW